MLSVPPWVPVVAPNPPPPADQPMKVWLDTGSGTGLEIAVQPADRWRVWPVDEGRHVLLIGPESPEDVDALTILANVRALWHSYQVDPDEQDVP